MTTIALPRWPLFARSDGGLDPGERERLTRERAKTRGERNKRRGYDPMDALMWAAVFVMVAVTTVYAVLFLRVAFTPNFQPPDGALQGLVLVVPIASGIALLKRERRNGD